MTLERRSPLRDEDANRRCLGGPARTLRVLRGGHGSIRMESRIALIPPGPRMASRRIDALTAGVDAGFARVDDRFGRVDDRLDAVNGRLDALNERLMAHLDRHVG